MTRRKLSSPCDSCGNKYNWSERFSAEGGGQKGFFLLSFCSVQTSRTRWEAVKKGEPDNIWRCIFHSEGNEKRINIRARKVDRNIEKTYKVL